MRNNNQLTLVELVKPDSDIQPIIKETFGYLTARDNIVLKLDRDNVITKESIKFVMLDCMLALEQLGFNTDHLINKLSEIKISIRKQIGKNTAGCYRHYAYPMVYENKIINYPPTF